MTMTSGSAPEPFDVRAVAELLGGARLLPRSPSDPLEAHETLLAGLPGQALSHLLGRLLVLWMSGALERALGMSLRTYQRRRDAPTRLLSAEQSGRAWKFAEILARATAVFGSQEEAERWLERPATGLNQRRPIDLLSTPAGVELVETFLQRLRYGARGPKVIVF